MEYFLLLFRIILCLNLLLFHFPSFSSSSSSSLHSSTSPLCHPDQSFALLVFKNRFEVNMIHASWYCDQRFPKTTTWENGTDCCSWRGVTCNSMSGHVIGLDLSCSGLIGTIDPNSTLFYLSHLQKLNLAHNYFYGSQLPSQIGGFVNLTHLNLTNCYLEGDIPSQISHLSKLASLDLSHNNDLELKDPAWKRLVQNATTLREIILDGAYMDSITPSPFSFLAKWSSSLVTLSLANTRVKGQLTSDIFCLPNLQELYLSGNSQVQVNLPMLNCKSSLSVLDLSGCSFQGSIPSSFSNLTHLTSLILSLNYLNSSSIPSSISSLQHLTHLELSLNEFSGSIPSFLSKLSHLTHLDLSHNELSGSIPSSLSNLQNLTYLDLSNNQLSGQIPDVLGRMSKLQILILHNNSLNGKLPLSLFSLTQLSWLDCSSNKFEGPLPNKITGFSNLTNLILNDNKLNGTIPSWCLSLPSLTSLDLTNNRFTGHIGAISSSSLQDLLLCNNKLQGNIPESIFNLANLTSLCLSSSENWNNLVHFPLFSKLQNLESLSLSAYNALSLKFEINVNYSFPNLRELHLLSNNLIDYDVDEVSVKFPNLVVLKLSNSALKGKIPKWIRDIDSLNFLKLSDNMLTSIDQLPWYELQYLDLSSNLMTGDISSFICNATSLSIINLSNNKFTGTFPQCFANFSSLWVVDLQMNNLHGTLPSTHSWNTYLRVLNLNGNQFKGQLPKSLSNCTYLEDLNLGNNQIEDSFPHWLQNLQYLKILVLRANKLYGPILSLVKKHPFPNLIVFDISCNNFSGPLPENYIKNFLAMKIGLQGGPKTILEYMKTSFNTPYWSRDLSIEYDDSFFSTIKGVNTNFMKIPSVLVNIDLSVNKFEGEILSVIGQLQGLKGLNLSHNRFTGLIPRSMGNLTSLESLDLSSNMLTGGIPIELTNLNSLEVLNLSHNHLVGPIPQGKQFNTFLNESYEGNIGLCGFPLSIQCNKGPDQPPPSSPTSETEEIFGFGWKPVAIGYGCGMVFGIGLGWLVLFIGKPIWLVTMFGAVPKKWMKKRTAARTRGKRARIN